MADSVDVKQAGQANAAGEMIKLKLPDGSVKEVPKGTTALEVARSISPRLADAALVAKTNGNLVDLTRPLEHDTELRILTEEERRDACPDLERGREAEGAEPVLNLD